MIEIYEQVERTLVGMGYDLVDYEGPDRSGLIRIFIDSENGITLDDCSLVSNQVTRLFEVEGTPYERLEVSSPGLDRPIKKLKDFQKFQGEYAKVQLKNKIEGQKKFKGQIGLVSENAIEFFVDDGESVVVDIGEIKKANLIPVD